MTRSSLVFVAVAVAGVSCRSYAQPQNLASSGEIVREWIASDCSKAEWSCDRPRTW
jgi:hypothetical protein